MSTYFKAVRPDGKDFRTGTIDYAAALGGDPVTLPGVPHPECCTSTVLHAATVPTEALVGGFWPCRLFEVTGTPVADEGHKRGFFSLAVVREVDAHQALGPQGEQVAALIDRAGRITAGEAEKLDAAAHAATPHPAAHAARHAAWVAAGAAARVAAQYAAEDAAQYAAEDAAEDAAWVAARDAAFALVVRDLISKEHYDLLTGPWAQVIGPAHPDDPNHETRTIMSEITYAHPHCFYCQGRANEAKTEANRNPRAVTAQVGDGYHWARYRKDTTPQHSPAGEHRNRPAAR